MLYHPIVVLLALLLPSSYSFPSKAQKPVEEKTVSPFTQEVDEDVTELLDQWHIPGLSIAVIDGRDTFSK
ncbi:MAG: hypothetical protein L6R35_006249, partial [Caloplaca aegaea]